MRTAAKHWSCSRIIRHRFPLHGRRFPSSAAGTSVQRGTGSSKGASRACFDVGARRGCQWENMLYFEVRRGGVPEWLKGADCKSVGLRLRWFESSLLHQLLKKAGFGEMMSLLCAESLVFLWHQAGVVQW